MDLKSTNHYSKFKSKFEQLSIIFLYVIYAFDDRVFYAYQHIMDGWPCFDCNLQIPSHMISKTLYIEYYMKPMKMIVL